MVFEERYHVVLFGRRGGEIGRQGGREGEREGKTQNTGKITEGKLRNKIHRRGQGERKRSNNRYVQAGRTS